MSKQNELLVLDMKDHSKKYQLETYCYLYDIVKDKIYKLLEENYMDEDFQNNTFLPKEFKDKK